MEEQDSTASGTGENSKDKPEIPASSPSGTPSRKRRHVENSTNQHQNEDEGMLCSVCLDVWTSAGAHRLCALRCGHLFGRSCVIRWLAGKHRVCPQCNAPAKKSEVREIYATRLIVVDTGEIENLRLQNLQLQSENRELGIQLEMQKTLVNFYRNKFENSIQNALKNAAAILTFEARALTSFKLDEGLCRVMAFCKQRKIICVSQEHTGPLWPGFGVRIVQTAIQHLSNHQPIHKKEIRDLVFHPTNPDLILSVGLDQFAKVTDVLKNKTVFAWRCEQRLWSCCWDHVLDGVVYVGSERGQVFRLSIENADAVLNLPLENITPVAVIAVFSSQRFNCLLCCRLLSVTMYAVNEGDKFKMQLLQEGKYSAMVFNENENNEDVIVILTCRPDGNSTRARHICYKLRATNDEHGMELVQQHVISCGEYYSQLFKPSIISLPEGLLFFAFDEATSKVCGWNITTDQCSQVLTIKTNYLARHIMAIKIENQIYVYILMPKLLKSYKIG